MKCLYKCVYNAMMIFLSWRFLTFKKHHKEAESMTYTRVFTQQKWMEVNKKNKELLDDFVVEMKSNKMSPYTIEQYMSDLKMIFVYILENMDNRYILDMVKRDFRQIKMWFTNERQVSPARCCRVMSVLHSALDYAEDEDDYNYEYNKSKKVKGLKKEKTREIVFLTDEQISRLRDRLLKKEEYKLLAYVDMLYDSGGRRRELLQIKREGLLEKNNTNIVRGKRGKMFPLLYFSHTKESLKLYLSTRKDTLDDLWICGEKRGQTRPAKYSSLYDFSIKLRQIVSDIEGKPIMLTPHSFRHSTIQNMQDGTHYICKELNRPNGFSLQEIKYLVHHENIGMTESYLKDNTEDMIQQIYGITIKN